jgi:hypothetical protein
VLLIVALLGRRSVAVLLLLGLDWLEAFQPVQGLWIDSPREFLILLARA